MNNFWPVDTALSTTLAENPGFNVMIVNPPMRDVAVFSSPGNTHGVRAIADVISSSLEARGFKVDIEIDGANVRIKSNGPPTEQKKIIIDALNEYRAGDWKFEGDATLVVPAGAAEDVESFWHDETTYATPGENPPLLKHSPSVVADPELSLPGSFGPMVIVESARGPADSSEGNARFRRHRGRRASREPTGVHTPEANERD